MKKLLWTLLAVLAVMAGCSKSPLPSSTSPSTPQAPEDTEPGYKVTKSGFSASRDNLKIGGYVYTPDGLEGKKPAIILCTGLDATYKETEPYAKAATKLGFVSFCFDFCGGPDEKSTSLSGGKKSDNSVLTELLDLEAVFNYASAREDVDPDNIVLMGGSQGGLVAGLYAARHPSDFKALGLMFPAFNLPDLVRDGVQDALETYGFSDLSSVPDLPLFFPQEYEGHKFYKKYLVDIMTLYPFEEIGAYKGPVLILHGDADPLVPVSISEQAAELYDIVDFYVLNGQGHGFNSEGTAKAIEYMEEFLSAMVLSDPEVPVEVEEPEE